MSKIVTHLRNLHLENHLYEEKKNFIKVSLLQLPYQITGVENFF